MNQKPSLSVILLTLNEDFHLGDAIDNVKDIAEEVFIVDSLSSDHTIDIALEKGAKVVQRPFTNFGDQWNYALNHLPIKTKWTMKMDPDERLTDELKEEIRNNLISPGDNVGFSFDRILYFMGKPMRAWTDRILRIWKTGSCHFTDVVVNEYPRVDGPIQHLSHFMNHLDSRDLHQWVEKQNRYTTIEALRRHSGKKMAAEPNLFGNSLERHMFLKKVFFYLPCRYILMFFHLYFLKGLWKEGTTGIYCLRMRIWSRQLIEAKLLEIENTGRLLQLPSPQQNRMFDRRILNSEIQRVFLDKAIS